MGLGIACYVKWWHSAGNAWLARGDAHMARRSHAHCGSWLRSSCSVRIKLCRTLPALRLHRAGIFFTRTFFSACLKVSLRCGRRGRRLWPSGAAWWMTLSSGRPSPASGCSGCRQAPPRAVLATACCTATENMLHQRLAQAAVAAARTGRGARYALRRTRSRTKPRAWAFQRPPTSEPSTTSVCGPPRVSSGYAALRGVLAALSSTAPSTAVAHGCGCPRSRERGNQRASQHCASPLRSAPYTTRSSLRRSCAPTCGAVVLASHCCGTTWPSDPTASHRFPGDLHPGSLHDLGPPGEESSARARKCVVAELKASCIAVGSVGIAASHAPACGPAWDRKSAWELGGMSGRSVRSRKCVLRVRVARICHPCGQSPGPASSAGGGSAPFNRALHVGHVCQPASRNGVPASTASRRPAAFRPAPPSRASRHRAAKSGARARMTGSARQRVCPRGPVRGRGCALRGL